MGILVELYVVEDEAIRLAMWRLAGPEVQLAIEAQWREWFPAVADSLDDFIGACQGKGVGVETATAAVARATGRLVASVPVNSNAADGLAAVLSSIGIEFPFEQGPAVGLVLDPVRLAALRANCDADDPIIASIGNAAVDATEEADWEGLGVALVFT
jgi:hypothetical protein